MRAAVRDFGGGVADLARGARLWIASPRLMLLGAVPALVVALLATGLLVLLAASLPGVAAALTPFADGWAEPFRGAVRALAGAVVLASATAVLVLGFAAVTIAVGDPWYERIARRVEVLAGGAPPERHEPWHRALRRALGEGLRLLGASVLLALLLFGLGLIPVVGWVVALLAGMLVGGRLLAVELTGFAFEARGIALRERRRRLAARRARVHGFGAAAYLLLLVPPVAVVAMPAAVAGATLLARAVLDEDR